MSARMTPRTHAREAAKMLLLAAFAHSSAGCVRPAEERAAPASTTAAQSSARPGTGDADAWARPNPPQASAAAPAAIPTQPATAASDAGTDTGESLLASDGTPLPQLDTRPVADSPALLRRMRLLVDAIARDDPAAALPAFFPVVAYEQVKAIEKPARDWQVRLVRAFERNIHEYHRALGKDVQALRFVALEIPDTGVRWMKPGSEGNRVGYFRVLRSRLRAEDDRGKEHTFEVTSLISWRGEWYVVHLNGFK